MNGEPLRRLRRHLPMNGEEPFLHLNAAAPPAPSAPPPHEWGAPPAPSAPPPHEWEPLRRLRRHLPMNGEPLRRLRRHLPMNGEPLRRLRRHLPMNGEEPFLHLLKGGEPGCPSLLVG